MWPTEKSFGTRVASLQESEKKILYRLEKRKDSWDLLENSSSPLSYKINKMSKPENLLIIDPAQELKFKGKRNIESQKKERKMEWKKKKLCPTTADGLVDCSGESVDVYTGWERGALSIEVDGRECLLLQGAIGNGEKISREWTEEKKVKNHPFQASQSCVWKIQVKCRSDLAAAGVLKKKSSMKYRAAVKKKMKSLNWAKISSRWSDDSEKSLILSILWAGDDVNDTS